MLRKIRRWCIPAFSLIICLGLQTMNAMECESRLDCIDKNSTPTIRSTSPSLQDILVGLNNKNTPLEQRIRFYNPTTILKGISEDLRLLQGSKENSTDNPVPDLLRKGIFAIHFHGVMTGEIPSEMMPFFETLQTIFPSKNKKKNPFLAIPDINANQRAELLVYLNAITKPHKINFQKSDLLDAFFSNNNSTLKIYKNLINKILNSFQEEIRGQFGVENNTLCIFGICPLQRPLSFYKHAILFGSPNSEIFCTLLVGGYIDEENFEEAWTWIQVAVNLGHLQTLSLVGLALSTKGKTDEAEVYFRRGKALGDLDSMCALGGILLKKDKKSEAEENFRKAANLGHRASMLMLGNLLFSSENLPIEEGKLDETEGWYKKAANLDDLDAMVNWGRVLIDKEQRKQAKELFHKALNLGNHKALLYLAGISSHSKAEGYYKKAISLGVKDAEIFYADFLLSFNRQEESLSYLEFHEVKINQFGDSSFDNKKSSEDREDELQPEIVVAKSDTEPVQIIPDDRPSLNLAESVVIKSNDINEKKESIPEISKKLQKYITRAEKREKASCLQMPCSFKKAEKPKTYMDVRVFALPEVHADITEDHEIKIQGLISSLANGECRGKFEKLTGYEDVYSMRLTKGDRLVFKVITSGKAGGLKEPLKAVT